MSWFPNLDAVDYSFVKFVDGIGTLYSIARRSVAHKESNSPTLWQSHCNSLQNSVRNIVIVGELAEPVRAVLVHTMADSFTSNVIDLFHREPVVKVDAKLKKGEEYVLVAESTAGMRTDQIFRGKAKGVFYFHRSVFFGTVTHFEFAPGGVKIRLDIPYGLYDGAQVLFSWIWIQDATGALNRPETTLGTIRLKEGDPTEFELSKYKGAGWEGYNFTGKIMSKDRIIAHSRMAGQDIQIDFRRASLP